MSRKALLLVTIFAEGGVFVLGLLLMRFSNFELQSRFHFSWNATVYALLLCIPLLLMLLFAVRARWGPLSRLRSELDEKIVPIFADSKLPDLALIALLAGAGEEFFFRGWLQRVLTDKFEIWLGVLIASLIFGLAHFLSITYAVYAFLTGLYLGLIYQASGNLYTVMVIHAVYDFIALIYLVSKRKSGSPGISVQDTRI